MYDSDGGKLLAEIRAGGLEGAFDFEGNASFLQMLEDQIAGKNDSWAVRWHASCFLRDLLVLYPGRALARNIGHDGSGTHSSAPDESFDVDLSSTAITVGGIGIAENAAARDAIKRMFGAQKVPPPFDDEKAESQRASRKRLQVHLWPVLRTLLARVRGA
jgi:hypothetical protein